MVCTDYRNNSETSSPLLCGRQWIWNFGNQRISNTRKNIAANLASFKNLKIWDGSGTDPEEALKLMNQGINHVRSGVGSALVRLTVPRLNGHSYQDNQAYKPEKLVKTEVANDPLLSMKKLFSASKWKFSDREACFL